MQDVALYTQPSCEKMESSRDLPTTPTTQKEIPKKAKIFQRWSSTPAPWAYVVRRLASCYSQQKDADNGRI